MAGALSTKTKIVATIGPATSSPDIFTRLIEGGVTVFRMNFSHGTLGSHAEMLAALQEARQKYPYRTAILGDLCGPKIRVAEIRDEGVMLAKHDEVVIYREDRPGDSHEFGTNYPELVDDVDVDHHLYIDDGAILLRVFEKQEDRLLCRVLMPGVMHSHKGINLPDSQVSIPSITERDWKCVDWAIENKLHFLAISFVRTAHEVMQLQNYLDEKGSDIQVVAKIEKPEAVDHIEEIMDAADAIMIARGDLGVEMDTARVPLIQKRILSLCRSRGKPCVVATQVLQTMMERPMPTRAEVSDISNAVLDLADALMLSGETAVGQYPTEAVGWIARTARITEEFLDKELDVHPRVVVSGDLQLTEVVAENVAEMVDQIQAVLVIVWSETGTTARLFSNARIDVPIVAFSSQPRVCEQMNLSYGLVPVCLDQPKDMAAFVEAARAHVLERSWADTGQQVVIVTGRPLTPANTVGSITVQTL